MYKQRKTGKIILAIFIILILLGSGAGAYYFFFMQNGEKPTEVTVSLELNGGTFSETPYGFTEENGILSKALKIGEAYGYIPEPTKGGFAFVGWSLTGEEPCIESADIVNAEKAFTLYAVWEVERIYTYKVYYAIYDVDTGAIYSTKLKAPQSSTAYNRSTVRPEILQFDGYSYFDGTTNDGKASDVSAKLIADNMNLFIYYVANTYKIKYSYSGVGATSEFVTTFKYSTDVVNLAKLRSIADIQNADARFVVSGMTFSHWSVNGKTFDDEAYITRANLADMGFALNLSNGGVDEVTLDALYEETTYNLTFVSQGDVVATDKVKFNALLTQPTEPEALGYTFVGWYAQEIGATGTQISEFTPIEYNIFYDNLVGAEFDAEKTTFTVEDSSYAIGNPTRKGYAFQGWEYDGEMLENSVISFSGIYNDITISATWALQTYTITYELNGGTCDKENVTQFNIETETFMLNNPAKVDYTFAGWTGTLLDAPETAVYVRQGEVFENLTFVANYTPITYQITYENLENCTFGGNNSNPNATEYNVETPTFTLVNPEKRGYDFAGWTYAYNGTAQTKQVLQIEKGAFSGNLTFGATFTAIKYTITLDKKDGSISDDALQALRDAGIEAINSSTIKYTIENGNFTLPQPTKGAHSFTGWKNLKTQAVALETNIDTNIAEDLEFEAVWNAKVYKIHYKLNGGHAPDGITYPKSYSFTSGDITPAEPLREGYTFGGWALYKLADDNTTWQLLEDVTSIACKKSTGDRKFVASWLPNGNTKYTVEYRLQPINGSTEKSDYTLYVNPTIERATTDTPVTKTPIEITGFTAEESSIKLNINGDGSTKFVFYYSRKTQYISASAASGTDGEGIESVDVSNDYGSRGNGNYYYEQDITVTVTLKAGYNILGIFEDDKKVSTTLEYKFKVEQIDRTFIAKANIVTYYITYYGIEGATFDGSTTNPNRGTYTVKDVFTLVNPELGGNDFQGWSGTFISEEAKEKVVTIENMATDLEFTAWFGENEYVIEYDFAGGQKADNGTYPVRYTKSSPTISPTTPVRLGYTFTGWTVLDKNGSEISGATTIPQGSFENRKFVAHWTPKTDTPYVVKHFYMDTSGNFALDADETENLKGTTDSTVTPPIKAKTGYTSPELQTKNIAGDGTTEIVYQYYRIAYTVTITQVGNGIDTITPLTTQYWGTTVSIDVVLKRGYYLKAWTQNSGKTEIINESNKQNTKLEFTMPTEDIALTVETAPIVYKVDYTLNGGQLESGKENPTSYTIEDSDFMLNNPKMTGFEFLGWTTQELSEPQLQIVVVTSLCKDLHYYAKFNASNVNYTVKYYYMTTNGLDYELKGTEQGQALAGDTITITPNDVAGFTAPAVQIVEIKPDGSTIVELKYTRNKYTITITQNETNSGIATLSGAGEHYFGETVSLVATLKDNYNFLGWIKDGVTVNETLSFDYTLTEAKDVTFVARTKGFIYQIDYDYGMAAVDPIDNKNNPTEYEYGVGATFKSPTSYKYTFLGWQVANVGSKDLYTTISFSGNSTGDVTLKMHWGKVNNSLRYMAKEDEEGYYLFAGRSAGYSMPKIVEIPDYVKLSEVHNGKYIDDDKIEHIYTYYSAIIVGEDFYNLFDAPQDNGIYKVKEIYGRFALPNGQYYTNFMTFENSGITDIKLGKFVETIGSYAFFRTNFTTFTASDSLKTINEGAFMQCNSLTSINLNKVKTIGRGAFYQCNALQSVDCGQLNEIGELAFYQCNSLQSVDFGSVETIGVQAFNHCGSLQSLDLKNVKTIGQGAFYQCNNLVTVSNATKLSSVDTSAFSYNSSLKTVDFSASQLTSIGASTFYNCFNLENIKMPNTLTEINKSAFYLCKSLREISIPSSVTTIGEYAFSFCDKLRKTGLDANSKLQTLSANAFQSCASLIEITIPSTLTYIGAAFRNCSKLYQITNLTSSSDSSLKNALFGDIPNPLASVSKTGNFDNGTLTEDTTKKIYYLTKSGEKILVDYYGTDRDVDLSGENFSRVYRFAFYDSTNLQSVILPQTLERLGIGAFYKCRNLMKVKWLAEFSSLQMNTDNVEGYNIKMFVECAKLVQLDLPSWFKDSANWTNWFDNINNGLEVIEHGESFKNRLTTSNDITTFTIASGDKAGTYFMAYSGTATTLDLSSYSKIYAGGLYGCCTLKTVKLSSAVTAIPESFFARCWNLTNITLPESVTSIGNYSFEECFSLSTLVLPTNVSAIGKYAFADCIILDDIVIPEKVTKIEEKTFYGCFNLRKCKISGNVASIGDYAFQVCPLDYVEEGASDYYFVLPNNCTISKNSFKQSRADLATLYGED